MPTSITFELEESTDDSGGDGDDAPRTTVKVRADDVSGSPISGGLVEIRQKPTGEVKTGKLEDHGMFSDFANVAIPCVVRVEKTGYVPEEHEITEDQIDSSIDAS